MAALLTSEARQHDKMVQYIEECRQMGIPVLPPDVNQSDILLLRCPRRHRGSGDLRFGLSALKNVGEGAVEAILEARRKQGAFRSLHDFCERVDLRAVNRRVIESFVKSGCFDSLDLRRAALFAAIEPATELVRSASATWSRASRACSACSGAPGSTAPQARRRRKHRTGARPSASHSRRRASVLHQRPSPRAFFAPS